MSEFVQGSMDRVSAGPSCARCFEGQPEVASRRFAYREEAFAAFAQLVNIGFMPAMCELQEGGSRVCWAPLSRQESCAANGVSVLEA